MIRLTLAVATLAFTGLLTFTADAQAAPKPPKGGSVHVSVHVGGGYRYYHGSYRGWNNYCWFPGYGCYGYYSNIDGIWFYWSAALGRFVPVSYMAQYPPTNPGVVPPGIGMTPAGVLPTGATPLSTVPVTTNTSTTTLPPVTP